MFPTARLSGSRIVRQAGKVAFHYGGGVQLYRYLNRDRLRILTSHRFSGECRPRLEARCAHLRRHYNVVSMDQVSAWLWHGTPLPPNAVALTVDDGYRDFYVHAFPVFAEYGLPVTVFLVSRFIDGRHWMWWDKVTYLFARTPRADVTVELPSGEAPSFVLGSVAQRERAAADLIVALTRFPDRPALEVVARLPGVLRADLPDQAPPEYAPLTWTQVREMMPRGISFGAHTMTHALLPSIEQPEMLRAELEGSKRRLEEEMNVEVAHFAYPNGDHNLKTREAVRAAGFRTAATTNRGTIGPGADPFALPRLGGGVASSEWSFIEQAAGFRPS